MWLWWVMAPKSFEDNRKAYDAKLKEIEQLSTSYVTFGFQQEALTKSQVKGNRTKRAGLSQAQIAAQNEFGTRTIPARPFMRTSFDENINRIQNAVNVEYDNVLSGMSTIRKSLDRLGIFGVGLIQQKIRAIHFPPNSPRTIAIKGSSKPLIDFGQMIQSVRHKVYII
jgi:hypothetical protein